MQRSLSLLGVGFLFLSGILFYAEHKQRAGQDDSAYEAVEQVLSAQNRGLLSKVESTIARADRDAASAFVRAKKRPRMHSFWSEASLAEPEAPKWLIVGERKIRASDTSADALLEDALEAHLANGRKLSLYSANGKYFLFIKGKVDGLVYASAYDPAGFFSLFRSADGIRTWLVQQDGTILFHSLPRYIGSNAGNLRPVAAGLQSLGSGLNSTFIQRYLGLEGRAAMGAWTSLPSLGVLVGSEWPKDASKSSSSMLLWYVIGTAIFGALLCGYFLGSRNPKRKETREVFDEAKLDGNTMDYLETVRATADQAIAECRRQENIAQQTLVQRNEAWDKVRFLDRRLTVLNKFQDRILSGSTGKQVWSGLGELFAECLPGAAVVVYRYSSTTFSLVPEAVYTGLELPSHAMAYLADARIFIGNPSLIHSTAKTEAFSRWNKARAKHMPLHQTAFEFFPISSQNSLKGMILVLFDERLNKDGEFAEDFALMEALVGRTSSFCDTMGPLLQFPYAKGNSGPALASTPNHPGSGPRST